MIKRIFEYVSLGFLTLIGLLKLKGKRINPPALRVLLVILTAMAAYLKSTMVLLVSGTWLIFILSGDLARLFGVNLSLFIPEATAKKEGENKTPKSSAKKKTSPPVEQKPPKKSFLKNCTQRFKNYIHGEDA